ncbi:MAG: putative zinc-binding peptidase [Xanthobacteraceae bacterium]
MKRFECPHCRAAVYFDNTACVSCKRELGYVPNTFEMAALDPETQAWKTAADDRLACLPCENRQYDACNWLRPAESGDRRCVACQHNRTIPDLSVPANVANWRKTELAKRHLFYSLMRWRLPIPTRKDDPEKGLAFDFLSDVVKADGTVQPVMTGHDTGLITLNIAEADDAEREKRRASMGEPYRTLLGHFRHEVGHYYWDRLVRDGGKVERSRQLFGDDSQNYGEALKAHYENGPPADWQTSFISSYATSHPWEDFAETWAHYIHMVDALETAKVFGINVHPTPGSGGRPQETEVAFDPYFVADAQALVGAWVPLTVAINSVNRSMGQPDLYPFVLAPPVVAKLQFIHEIIHR